MGRLNLLGGQINLLGGHFNLLFTSLASSANELAGRVHELFCISLVRKIEQGLTLPAQNRKTKPFAFACDKQFYFPDLKMSYIKRNFTNMV